MGDGGRGSEKGERAPASTESCYARLRTTSRSLAIHFVLLPTKSKYKSSRFAYYHNKQ
jgi:hypothetical protein